MAITAARRPFHPDVARAWRYPAKMTQVMKDQVSLGSQPQYRPQASWAQIAPAITAKVQIGKANAIARYAIRSRIAAEGRIPRRGAAATPESSGSGSRSWGASRSIAS